MSDEYATRGEVGRLQANLDSLRAHVDAIQEHTEDTVNEAIRSNTKNMRWILATLVAIASVFFTVILAGDHAAQEKQAAIDSQQNNSIGEADRKLIEALQAIKETSILMQEQAKQSETEDGHLAKEIEAVEKRTDQQIERTLQTIRRHEQRGH